VNNINITKQKFLDKHERLVELLVSCWDQLPNNEAFHNASPTRFRRSESKNGNKYLSLNCAFQDFEWEKQKFVDTSLSLVTLGDEIKQNIKVKSKGDLLFNLCKVLEWGGVLTTSIMRPILEKYEHHQLVEYFEWVSVKQPFDESKHDLGLFADVPESVGKLLSNSGLTKIYCAIGSSGVIYDDRVAASLGRIITWYLGTNSMPSELVFVVGGGSRDPSTKSHRFLKKGGSSSIDHAQSNLKANWLISACVCELMLTNESFKSIMAAHVSIIEKRNELWLAMRIYEAALFMAGYSLNPHGKRRTINAALE